MTRHDDDPTIARLLGPTRPEILCEECFEQLDVYVEADLADADPDAVVPGMRAHLEGCPACSEEFASLRAYVLHEAEPGGPD